MGTKQPKVLIIILNYGTFDLTLKLVKQIQNDLEYDNYSIMVIDNCSPNESAKVLKDKSKKMNYIFYENRTNTGYAAGNNIGIRYGIEHNFDYSWVLNNDVEVNEKNVLSHMVDIINQRENIGCIGPRVYNLNGEICAPYVKRPTFWSMTFGIVAEKAYRKKYITTSSEVYRVYGCCMLLKNKAMAEVGGMDERTFLYGEENILAERLLAKSYITFYDAEISVTHRESTSMKKMIKKRRNLQIKESIKSRELYLKEYRHFSMLERWLCHIVRSTVMFIR